MDNATDLVEKTAGGLVLHSAWTDIGKISNSARSRVRDLDGRRVRLNCYRLTQRGGVISLPCE